MCGLVYLNASNCWQTKMADAVVESAPADENDDSWLYGESTNDQKEDQTPGVSEKVPQQTDASVRDYIFFSKIT